MSSVSGASSGTGSGSDNLASLFNNPTLLGTMLGGVNVSGLQSVLEAEMSQVSAPLSTLTTEQSTLSAQAQSYSTVQGALQTVLSDAQALQDASSFNQTSTPVSSAPTVATASGTGGPYGDYALAVSALAVPGSIDSGFQSGSSTASLGWQGNMTVTVYVGIPPQETAVQVLVPVSAGDSLETVAQNIQAQAASTLPSGTNLTATVLPTTQNGQSGNILALSVNGGLTAADVTTSGTVPALGFTNATTYSPATYSIDGVQNQSSSNQVQNALPGVNLSLASTGQTTLSIGSNPSATANQVNTLVGDISTAVQTIEQQTTEGQPLAGNAALNNLANQLQSTLTSTNSNLANGYQSLTDMGLGISYSQASGGLISFNPSTFTSALSQNPQAVTDLFTGQGGVATQLVNLVQSFTQSGTGILASDQQAIQGQESLLNNEETALQATVTQQQTQLQTQFMTYLQDIASNVQQQDFLTYYANQQSGSSSSSSGSGSGG